MYLKVTICMKEQNTFSAWKKNLHLNCKLMENKDCDRNTDTIHNILRSIPKTVEYSRNLIFSRKGILSYSIHKRNRCYIG